MEFCDFDSNKDWPFFELSENESYRETKNGQSIPSELLESRKKDIRSFLVDENFLVKILKENDETCGIIIAGVHENGDSYLGFIYNIYISQKYRQKGLGSVAMNAAVDFCKEKKCSKMLLNVGPNNSKAISV